MPTAQRRDLKRIRQNGYEWSGPGAFLRSDVLAITLGADTEHADRGYDRSQSARDYGVGDYWDDVDQYVRNHLTESQLLPLVF